MNKNDNLRFAKKIYKTKNEDGTVRQMVSIDIVNNEIGISFPTPYNAFLLQYQNRKVSTVELIANILVRFFNYLFYDMKNPIESIEELTLQHGIDFLSNLNCKEKEKTQKAEYLTKFYYFCKQHDMVSLENVQFLIKKNSFDKEYMENIFNGKYEVINKQSPDVIHELDLKYLPLFFETIYDVAPDIYLGAFFQFAGGMRVSEIVSVEYCSIRKVKESTKFSLSISLKDKDLRPDLATAFISKVKRKRTQVILPIFGDALRIAFENHKENYHKKGIAAVFIDANGNPMTANTYRNKFNKAKRAFIKRLFECEDTTAQTYALYLSSYRWSTHIGRGTYSNIVAQNANNIGEIAIMRGDSSYSSSLPYLNDNKSVEKKVQDTFDQFYKTNFDGKEGD